jgi:hypothetical protein
MLLINYVGDYSNVLFQIKKYLNIINKLLNIVVKMDILQMTIVFAINVNLLNKKLNMIQIIE